MDVPIYFLTPLAYFTYCKSAVSAPKLFEVGYPAHPTIIERRRKAVNKCCFFAPSIVKNEIEYMHSKISGVKSDDDIA